MGSALPADTEASDTPDSVYREQFSQIIFDGRLILGVLTGHRVEDFSALSTPS